ncbi:putative 2-dehydropantoate 2-reductase [Lachnellula suecica]|uniref:Putative 2-dehydropantoate 2-reductase n=1 Tax=Lachnellula suecica TaxID=602035 RepID=A0A8T9CAI3_9HELO|nr:putative 2-dehydropantoate 2-reductase [Lachnellula suecica]
MDDVLDFRGVALSNPTSSSEDQEPAENPQKQEVEVLDSPGQTSNPWSEVLDQDASTSEIEEEPWEQELHTATDNRVDVENEHSSTIHVLGSGPTGKFIAHSIAALSHAPPVTLLLHTNRLMRKWNSEGRAVSVFRDGKLSAQSKIQVEFARDDDTRAFQGGQNGPYQHTERSNSIIKHLIVTTDGPSTLPALSRIMHRLRSWSTILFLQDGMGIVDKVNDVVFPDPRRRPNYALGNMTHKLTPTEKDFTIFERKSGGISFSTLVRATHARNEALDSDRNPLVHAVPRTEFHMEQLEKLAINATLGPLSVLYDCPNDQLLHNYNVCQTMRLILKETSLILQSLPELSKAPKIQKHFSAQRLEWMMVSIIKKTGGNSTTMLQEIKDGKRSGVEFYNGYLVRRATELGIPCPHNEMLLAMVNAKSTIRKRRDDSYIPIRNGR